MPCGRMIDIEHRSFDEYEQALRNSGWVMTEDGRLHACDRHAGHAPVGVALSKGAPVLIQLRTTATTSDGLVEEAVFLHVVRLPGVESLGGGWEPSRSAIVRYTDDESTAELPLDEIIPIR